MAWVKIPPENHDVLRAALPKDPRVETLKMFGGLAALVNGNMFGGLFGKSFIVKLGEADYAEAMTLDGAAPFDPMGNGRVMSNTVFMPEATLDDAAELRDWLRRAFAHAATLPVKRKKQPAIAKQPAKATPTAKAKAKAKPEARPKPKAKANKLAARASTRRPAAKRSKPRSR